MLEEKGTGHEQYGRNVRPKDFVGREKPVPDYAISKRARPSRTKTKPHPIEISVPSRREINMAATRGEKKRGVMMTK